MGEKVYIFNTWPRDVAILYHKTFHHSFSLHLNHLIFLHIYLFGLFLLCACFSWLVCLVLEAAFITYACKLIQPSPYAIVYVVILCAIGLAAMGCLFIMETELDYEIWEIFIVAGGIILFSFACQLIGHYRYEKYTAPTSLTNSLVAAPILEFQSFLYWFGYVKMDDDVPDLTLRIRDNRTQLAKLAEESRDQII